MTGRRRRWPWVLGGLAGLGLLQAALAAWLSVRDAESHAPDAAAEAVTPAVVARGAYLARAGNCRGCHTRAGGADYAGGRGVETPFGVVHAPNITPDARTGLGEWSAGDFWRALHQGRSKDGRLLYPAFPYPSYTALTRADSDALYAYLRSVAPVTQARTPHALGFPFNTQAALAVWRALYFQPAAFVTEPAQSTAWNRGKYLVQALGHCAACHSQRNVLGATPLNTEFGGGLMPDQAWYAPSLASPREAGVQAWPRQDVVRLLKDGVTAQASVAGPMAEVVYSSTQYLDNADLDAMAQFLASVPVREPAAKAADGTASAVPEMRARGEQLYGQHCAACHGEQGQGVPAIYPALAGNRAVTLAVPNNLVQVIRQGGFAPSTPGNPQPFGMPPFGQVLSPDDVAAVTTYVRQSWGNQAAPVSPLDVLRIE